MGLVVAATHLQLEQPVALKFLRGNLAGQTESRARFMREAKAAAQLRSEHVGRVLDVGVTEDGTPFMVMEYLEGQSLDTVIAVRGRIGVSTAAEYAIQVCEGLAEAHGRGIVHRDIKPSNLFLVDRPPGWGTIKILDFGISKVSLARASDFTETLNMGTPCYMSPEQLQSAANVDHRTDIWSLGSTLYELLAGKRPFDATLPLLSLAVEIVTKEPQALAELRPEIPVELSAIIGRCMAKERDERFASAAELAMALIPFAEKRARVVGEHALSLASPLEPPFAIGGEGAQQRTPPEVKVPTAEMWKVRGSGGDSGGDFDRMTARTATALGNAGIRTGQPVTPPVVQHPMPVELALPIVPSPALGTSLRRRLQKQVVVVAAGLVLVTALLALARLGGDRSTLPAEVVFAPPAPPALPSHPSQVEPSASRPTVLVPPPATTPDEPRRQEMALVAGAAIKLAVDRNREQSPRRRIIAAPRMASTRPVASLSAQPTVRRSPEALAGPPARSPAQFTVDPAGGRAPTRPIQTSSPYGNP
jgi:serine/threonine-protein kinase